MRNIFMVLAKLVGLLQIYWGVGYISAMATTSAQMSQMQSHLNAAPNGGIIQALPIVGFSLLTLGLGAVLIFCTNWLANVLEIKDEKSCIQPSTRQLLLVGVKLIGVYILVDAIPEVFKSLSQWIITNRQFGSANLHDELYEQMFRNAVAKGFVSTVLPSVLRFCVGVFLALKTDIVLRLLSKEPKPENESVL